MPCQSQSKNVSINFSVFINTQHCFYHISICAILAQGYANLFCIVLILPDVLERTMHSVVLPNLQILDLTGA